MKFDQDLFLNLWYELKPRVRCAFGNVLNIVDINAEVDVGPVVD